MIISSDEEAAPPLNPSKKARKPRLHENNILMGQKDLNSPKRPRKNVRKTSLKMRRMKELRIKNRLQRRSPERDLKK